METIKFKTNIKCDACVAKVTPHLNELQGIENWTVDLKDPDRILTVKTENANIPKIKEGLAKAGYNAEKID